MTGSIDLSFIHIDPISDWYGMAGDGMGWYGIVWSIKALYKSA